MDTEEKKIVLKWLDQRFARLEKSKKYYLEISSSMSIDGYASYERGIADGRWSAFNDEMSFLNAMKMELEVL